MHRECELFQEAVAGQRWRENNLIFPSSIGTLMDASHLRQEFNQVLERAGLPKARFHDLRHTAASLMLNNGIPINVVASTLGHASPVTTLQVYSHTFSLNQEGVARLMDELVSPVKVTLATKTLQETSAGEM